eukprot:TRINITY_DN4088_c0_g1_i1.p1 TRINITY_DN4088_c0_g1~~TRINITY_DN4088_c0_g1_i1.p1  ORF type:complete len:282 (-),score=78.89 TRINITY_DN4088_c0_g1_i1:234-1049(-)
MVAINVGAAENVIFLCGNPNYEPNLERVATLQSQTSGRVLVGTQKEPKMDTVGAAMIDLVVTEASGSGDHSQALFFEIFRVLRAGGRLVCYEPLEGRTVEESENLKVNLTLSGFTDTKISANDTFIEVVSTKPEWVGSSQKIVRKIKKKTAETTAPLGWAIDEDADDGLMNESDLVDEIDFFKPGDAMEEDTTSCAPGRACANCVCGRAEGGGEKTKLTLDMVENPGVDSSCGSCSLGDAYRCAGCPYRGLPAFTPGEKIKLPDDFFTDDL